MTSTQLLGLISQVASDSNDITCDSHCYCTLRCQMCLSGFMCKLKLVDVLRSCSLALWLAETSWNKPQQLAIGCQVATWPHHKYGRQRGLLNAGSLTKHDWYGTVSSATEIFPALLNIEETIAGPGSSTLQLLKWHFSNTPPLVSLVAGELKVGLSGLKVCDSLWDNIVDIPHIFHHFARK